MSARRPGLGRLPAPDPRDRQYPLRTLLPAAPSRRTWRYWNANGWWGDQGLTPTCVAFAWLHYLEDGPVTQNARAAPVEDPLSVYNAAQRVDEWPGEGYDGTSVRAGAKVLQARGYLTEYRWAFTLDDVVRALLDVGPVVVGTIWTEAMFEPDDEGFLSIAGAAAGGHAYVLNGVNTAARVLRLKNSWGRGYGRNGFAYLAFDDFATLLAQDGEACLATEVRQPQA